MGHGSGGLQPRRRSVDLPPARPCPLPRLPMGRGRPGGLLRHRAATLPRPRALERPRPDPQGTDLRADRQRGQPRRGRQGVLVVPRRAAQPRLEPLALPLPARRVPLQQADRGERPPRTARPGIRAPGHRVFDDDRYWVVDVDYAKATPFDLLMTIRVTNAGPDPDTLHVLPHLWYRNTWSWDGKKPHELIADGTAVRTEHPFL